MKKINITTGNMDNLPAPPGIDGSRDLYCAVHSSRPYIENYHDIVYVTEADSGVPGQFKVWNYNVSSSEWDQRGYIQDGYQVGLEVVNGELTFFGTKYVHVLKNGEWQKARLQPSSPLNSKYLITLLPYLKMPFV